MVNQLNRPVVVNIQLTWQMILWRLLLTLLLLMILAGSGVTVFSSVTTRADARVLPTLSNVEMQER